MGHEAIFRTLFYIRQISDRGIADVAVPGWSSEEFSILIFRHIPPALYPYIHDGKRMHVKGNLAAETSEELINSLHDWEMS